MFQINENYQKLPGSYLFSTIAKKVAAYSQANPDKTLIRSKKRLCKYSGNFCSK